jgi:hypothetical protein
LVAREIRIGADERIRRGRGIEHKLVSLYGEQLSACAPPFETGFDNRVSLFPVKALRINWRIRQLLPVIPRRAEAQQVCRTIV